MNKAIKDDSYDGIEYNFLNLPVKIRVKNKGTIEYEYDAAGNKLRKITTEGTLKTVTSYIGNFVYQFRTTGAIADGIDTLQYFTHEEGRIRPKGAGFVFDYFVKDHLGNIRTVLTEETQTDMYPAATMETANATVEESFYSGMDTRADPPGNYPSNTPPGNAKVALVKGNNPLGFVRLEIGPGILLKVMTGDQFNVTANSWWSDKNAPVGSSNPMGLNQILNAIGGSTVANGAHFNAGEVQNSTELYNSVTSFLNTQNTFGGSKPRAFLNWIVFDEHFNYIANGSGYEQVDGSGVYKTHAPSTVNVIRNGYLFAYVSNETPNIDVYFDNLQVTHVRGPLVEENVYYPFGLTAAGISSKALGFGDPKNKKEYAGNEIQDKEFVDGSGLELYDFNARTYYHQVGRFIQIDPLSEEADQEGWSPYHYSYDNPVTYSDPDGKCPCLLIPLAQAVVAAIGAAATTYVVVKSYQDSDLDLNVSLPAATGTGNAPPVMVGGAAQLDNRVEMQLRAYSSSNSTPKPSALKAGSQTNGLREAGSALSKKGSNNQKTKESATVGQEAHRQRQAELESEGARTEVPMRLKDGTKVRKDAVEKDGTAVIIKPDTPSGRKSGEARKSLLDKNKVPSRIEYYDPNDPKYKPGSSTYIGPKSKT